MDFNTGAGGAGDSGGPSAGPGGSPRGAQSAAAEFRYTDPVQTFIATVQAVVLRPVDFFRGILRQGDLINPLIFALICYEVAAILGGLLRVVGIGATNQGFGEFLVSIILAPIFAAIGLFIGAGILHLLVMLIVGSRNSGFEATLRVVAYSAVTSLVSWIPYIGGLLSLYGIYLGIVGIREMHNTTTGKAALVVLIPAAIVLLLVFFVIGAAAFFILSQR
ncbi:MAG: YIP1 family protein [Actinomycetota bacterium]|nr:YIP1 family protein [Actinomycetota bacterium]MDQ5818561.1 YIP1 family protein [Actinomycetota bacterium]